MDSVLFRLYEKLWRDLSVQKYDMPVTCFLTPLTSGADLHAERDPGHYGLFILGCPHFNDKYQVGSKSLIW